MNRPRPKTAPRRRVYTLVSMSIAAAFAMTLAAETVSADPPPSTPAHGIFTKENLIKNKGKHDEFQVKSKESYGIDTGSCNRDLIRGVLGVTAGAAVGSTIGNGDDRTGEAFGGAILGALVGGSIGRSMDQIDQNCVGQVLERAEDGKSIVWRNPEAGARYEVTPAGTYRNERGNYCREYTTMSEIGGKARETYATACRRPDGSWQLGG